jgi:glucosamine 6-phosphate synthetase-like amidotransferase/phosphosugar isomerase protein
MCGVFGWIGKPDDWRPAHRLLVELAVAHEERGQDAAGWAALTTRGELLWQRRPGPAGELFDGPEFRALRRRRIVMAIGHTRHATAGAPAVNGNNHPHLAGDWALVHNGVIPGHRVIAACHGLRLTSECDSEVLARLLAYYGERHGPEICLTLDGSQSVLAINHRSRRLLAWTNGEMPLVAFRVESIGGLWWASTAEIAEEALGALDLQARFAAPEQGLVYRMELRDGEAMVNKARRRV